MWRTIASESKKFTGYHYITYEHDVQYGGIMRKTATGHVTGVELVFVNLPNKSLRNQDGDYTEGDAQAIITEKWCKSKDIVPDEEDFIYDEKNDLYYRVVGVGDYTLRGGIYLLKIRRDQNAAGTR